MTQPDDPNNPDRPQGYGRSQDYGAQGAGYTPQGSYGEGYGSQPSYGSQQGYGGSQEYAGAQAYGGAQSYGGGQAYGSQGAGQAGQAQTPPEENPVEMGGGFFSALFDLEFKSFITVKFAKIIFVLLIAIAAFLWLFMTLIGFMDGVATGFGALLLGWIPGLINIIVYRIILEVVISLVRTSQNTAATRTEIEMLRQDLYNRR